MFKNKSAWFSSSVPQACHNFWRYLRAKTIFGTRVAVFHSLFLSACERRQSVKSVCIGHYVLPPASVQDEVRQVVGRLIWEFEDEQSVAQGFGSQTEDECNEVNKSNSGPFDTGSESEAPQSVHCPVTGMRSGYISMDNLQKYSGDLCDFHPGSLRCSHCKGHCCPLHT
ncbi:hypothetical protein KUCAC02_001459 [Chaenocephalus aceratus]|uniref:Uncharacterized protein n=1 Tax=Chaenocephalus aceratus TaxID=36190 RepID=A0ACB9XT69_CHAAC|nr:hypothetical protein KUCAC02_001459 [Chaenocephalus aceratus]